MDNDSVMDATTISGGNTGISSSSSSDLGNTRPQISPSKHWCFTWNNAPEGSEDLIMLNDKVSKYCFQEEIGDSGTYHFQGYLEFNRKIRPMSVFKQGTIHWEKCRDIKASKAYCSDATKRKIGGRLWENCLPARVIDPLEGKQLYQWQAKTNEIIKEEPDDRTIHWIWESAGCTGKTSFIKHRLMNPGLSTCTYVMGGSKDVKYALIQMAEIPKTVFVDLSRTVEGFVSYQMLEEVKNGLIFSTKYESGMKLYNPPHLIVMANFPPEFSKLSLDRWKVWKIVDKDLVPAMDQVINRQD